MSVSGGKSDGVFYKPKNDDPSDSSLLKVYYAPGREMGKKTEIFGIIFRGTVVFCAIFGLIRLLYQAVGIYTGSTDSRFYSLSSWYIALISILFSAACVAASYNRITKIVL